MRGQGHQAPAIFTTRKQKVQEGNIEGHVILAPTKVSTAQQVHGGESTCLTHRRNVLAKDRASIRLRWLVGTHCSVWNAPKPAAVGGLHPVMGAANASRRILGLLTAPRELHAPERWLVMQPVVLRPRHILQAAGPTTPSSEGSNMQLSHTRTS